MESWLRFPDSFRRPFRDRFKKFKSVLGTTAGMALGAALIILSEASDRRARRERVTAFAPAVHRLRRHRPPSPGGDGNGNDNAHGNAPAEVAPTVQAD